MTKKRILLDCDDCIFDMLPHLIERYNEKTDDFITMNDITTWEIYDIVKYPQVIKDLFNSPDFFFELQPKLGATSVIKELNDDYELYITTFGSPRAIMGKQASLNLHFPFLAPEQVVYGYNKGLYKADIMIDDNLQFQKQFKKTNPQGVSIVFDLPHNRATDFLHYRVTDFFQVYDIIDKLENR